LHLGGINGVSEKRIAEDAEKGEENGREVFEKSFVGHGLFLVVIKSQCRLRTVLSRTSEVNRLIFPNARQEGQSF